MIGILRGRRPDRSNTLTLEPGPLTAYPGRDQTTLGDGQEVRTGAQSKIAVSKPTTYIKKPQQQGDREDQAQDSWPSLSINTREPNPKTAPENFDSTENLFMKKKRSYHVSARNFSRMPIEPNEPYMHHNHGDWAVPLKLAYTASSYEKSQNPSQT